MQKQELPRRQPISETISGVITRIESHALLSLRELSAGEVVASGDFTLRYGITYLGKPHLSIVPDLVVADYGEMLVGEAAWDFLMKRGHLYPRADILGQRNDGEDDMVALKQLDFDYPYDVFAFRPTEDHQPFARLSAAVGATSSSFPQRMLQHLPCYCSLSDWLARE